MKNVKALIFTLAAATVLMSACSSKPTTDADRAKLEKAQHLADRHDSRARN